MNINYPYTITNGQFQIVTRISIKRYTKILMNDFSDRSV